MAQKKNYLHSRIKNFFTHPFPVGKERREQVLDGHFVASICTIVSVVSNKKRIKAGSQHPIKLIR
jgi:hypothetical protein